MPTDTQVHKFLVFAVVWAVLAMSGAAWILTRNTAKEKKQGGLALAGVTILLLPIFVWWISGSVESLWVTVPATLFIGWINLKLTVFCEKCSAFNQHQPFMPAKFCRKCGAPLEKTPL